MDLRKLLTLTLLGTTLAQLPACSGSSNPTPPDNSGDETTNTGNDGSTSGDNSGSIPDTGSAPGTDGSTGTDTDTGTGTDPGTGNDNGGSAGGGAIQPVCAAGNAGSAVQAPQFVRNLRGQTGWFASPLAVDLDNDGHKELIAAYYDLYVYSDTGTLLDREAGNGGRIYAPHVVTDLEGDGIMDIVAGQGRNVYAYEWRNGALQLKTGWPADTTTAGTAPEVRGLAVADLDRNGSIEIVATTTQTASTSAGGAQVFVFAANGRTYQPGGLAYTAWPRYNNRSGDGGDADRNVAGHHGYGCYGLNVGVGNIDDDSDLEIITTYDNHHIQAFDRNGEAIDASAHFTQRQTAYNGQRMTWGQFIRWADPQIEENHYHLHTGVWPNPGNGEEWLQWTASPPNVVDLNGDGRNEVLGVPNVEKNEPYVTQAYALMVLQGAHGDGSNSGLRLPGWETLPRGGTPMSVGGWYPPNGIPAAATVDIQGDARPEIVVSLNDGYLYAFGANGQRLWRYNYTHGLALMFASEPVVADLNQDGTPEIVFSTFGAPTATSSGRLMILAANGTLLHDVALPHPGSNGNGNGAPAAPTIADLDGDGTQEILVQTFDHGLDVFTVPGSGGNCRLWTTARGGPLRMGMPSEF